MNGWIALAAAALILATLLGCWAVAAWRNRRDR